MIRRFRFVLPLLIAAAPLRADLTALRVLQSGDPLGSMVIHERGLVGRGELIAIVDQGVDVTSCALADEDGSLPPFNTGTREGALDFANVDRSRRKVVAYDLLFSCDQYPDSSACDREGPTAVVGAGWTMFAALAAGDGPPFDVAGEGDGLAPAAKLIIQDTGESPSRIPFPDCTLGALCRLTDITPVLAQAYRQGARIQSHQWTERAWPRDLSSFPSQTDAFVSTYPDFVIVFEAGDAGTLGSRSIALPGTAKNVIQVGGTREWNFDDGVVWERSGRGAAPDGRVKPDLVAPSYVYASSTASATTAPTCDGAYAASTSMAAPLVAGAAALVRQYYREGYYPTGAARERDALEPSAALVKATLIASARRVPYVVRNGVRVEAAPVPSFEQGYGMPVLGDVLGFEAGAARMRAIDRTEGLGTGESWEVAVRTATEGRLSATLVWTDPAGAALVNDLDVELIGPDGARAVGNAALTGGAFDRTNNVEKADLAAAAAGEWRVRVTGHQVAGGERQPFALVVAGDLVPELARRRLVAR